MPGTVERQMFIETGHPGYFRQSLVHFRICADISKIRHVIPVQYIQRLPVKEKMHWKPCLHPCLDGLEVQPSLAVYLDEIATLKLGKVRETKSQIATEQESVKYVAEFLVVNPEAFQFLQLVGGEEFVFPFFLLDLVFPER